LPGLTRQVTNRNCIFPLHVLAGLGTNGNCTGSTIVFTGQVTNGN
jgi:hypothetical protein